MEGEEAVRGSGRQAVARVPGATLCSLPAVPETAVLQPVAGRTTDGGVQAPARPRSLRPPALSPPYPPAHHRAGEAPNSKTSTGPRPSSVLPDGLQLSLKCSF